MSFADIYSDCKDSFYNDKPKCLELLSEHFDLANLVPLSFYHAYNKYYGIKRDYSLYPMFSVLILQKFLVFLPLVY